jgi:crystallin alpha B
LSVREVSSIGNWIESGQLNTDSSMMKVDQPFIKDASGEKKLSLRFDCSQFKPEEISVKVTDKHLCVHAKHEENSEGKKIYREFTQNYTLPENVEPQKLTSTLSKDGVLTVEAPAPPSIKEAPKEYLVPMTQK